MNRDDIIRMAREAGFVDSSFCRWSAYSDDLERFAALVAAAERDHVYRLREQIGADVIEIETLKHAIREAMDLLDQPEPRVHAAYGELHKAICARGET